MEFFKSKNRSAIKIHKKKNQIAKNTFFSEVTALDLNLNLSLNMSMSLHVNVNLKCLVVYSMLFCT